MPIEKDGYRYHILSYNRDRTKRYLRCKKYYKDGCGGFGIEENGDIRITKEHNHPPFKTMSKFLEEIGNIEEIKKKKYRRPLKILTDIVEEIDKRKMKKNIHIPNFPIFNESENMISPKEDYLSLSNDAKIIPSPKSSFSLYFKIITNSK
jgi:hypothetical protein